MYGRVELYQFNADQDYAIPKIMFHKEEHK